MKDALNLVDINFSHSELGYASDYQESQIFRWDRRCETSGKPTVYTDLKIEDSSGNNNYAWILEPFPVNKRTHKLIKKMSHRFEGVLTYEKSLLDLGRNFVFCPFGGCWIETRDQNLHSKSRGISVIASAKNMTDGHRLRHTAISRFGDKMDVFGGGYKPLILKIDGLKDYRYSLVIENCRRDFFFSEKLIDCFMTGTIPIYWGCPSIYCFFDARGIITFRNLRELSAIISEMTEEQYLRMLPYIKTNFELAKNYLLPDDHVYKRTVSQSAHLTPRMMAEY